MAAERNQVPLDDDQLNELVGHLQAEEDAAKQATLSSIESLQAWIVTHPALRNSGFTENIAQFAPALITVLRRLLGF